MNKPLTLSTLALALAAAYPARAQTAALDQVVVSVERARQSSFDAPAAITAVTREVIESGGPQVNLSEVLNRVPGITVLNRQNYAQDLQLSIRGFGSRSTFGIRGVRLIVDGIPATMPDGQGQASNIALGSASRIEVLRGPLAQLYGNAAGGVVQVFTDTDAREPVGTLSLAAGPWDQTRVGAHLAAGGDRHTVVLDASRYRTDGWREHSAAERTQLNGRWAYGYGAGSRVSVTFNALEQPESQDPIGLATPDWRTDPRQVAATALAQDASKSVAQRQLGTVLEHAIDERTSLTARLYFGGRELDNKLSVPPTAPAQTRPTGAGGIVQFEREYGGVGLLVSHVAPLDGGRKLRLSAGADIDRMTEDRRGYLNLGGVQGDLRRDERNTVSNRDFYAQGAYDLAAAWTVTAGLRSSKVRFRTEDHYIVVAQPPTDPIRYDNPDDSGRTSFSATSPVLGVAWRAAKDVNVYANVGRGFETPTFTEASYRKPCPDPRPADCEDSGMNTDLKAARSRHAEVGAKWRLGPGLGLDVALFDIATRDEIVVEQNSGGRSTFRNAGKTSRRGLEFLYTGRYGGDWRATLMLSLLRARFDDEADNGAAAGKRLPGTPERTAFAELVWEPAKRLPGFHAAAELVHTGAIYVNDTNTNDPGKEATAPAATVLNLRAGWRQSAGGWSFSELLRLDNATDRRYAGSVIVNDANKRYFEPALPRNWMLALTASYTLK